MYLIALMHRRQLMVDDLIQDTKQQLSTYKCLPDKTLVYRTRGIDKVDYYEQECKNNKITIIPLGKDDNKTVIAYKRRRYLKEKLKILEADKKAIDQFLSDFKDYSPEAIRKGLPLAYKHLPLNCYENYHSQKEIPQYGHLPDSITKDKRFQELLKWQSEKYKRNPFKLPDDPNIARDGTPMRSKGECMWWDNILFEGLPCLPDPEIEIQGKSGQWHKLYPDFVFKCFDGTYLYVEHFGDWADEDYAERNKRKIQEYLDCGIVLGDNLIVTSDNADHRTNELMIVEALEKIKKRMFT